MRLKSRIVRVSYDTEAALNLAMTGLAALCLPEGLTCAVWLPIAWIEDLVMMTGTQLALGSDTFVAVKTTSRVPVYMGQRPPGVAVNGIYLTREEFEKLLPGKKKSAKLPMREFIGTPRMSWHHDEDLDP